MGVHSFLPVSKLGEKSAGVLYIMYTLTEKLVDSHPNQGSYRDLDHCLMFHCPH